MTFGRAILLALTVPAVGAAQSGFCNGPERPLAPSRDLYCIELIAAPGITGAEGRVELGHPAGPFTIAVTSAGEPRYAPVVTLTGLPNVSTLGGTTYVAWIASPLMHPVRLLGAVGNGRTVLPTITFDKFVILVTAETSASVSEPTGRIVLRGASPSTRLQPADLMQFNLGASTETTTDHGRHQPTRPRSAGDSARWTSVPMPAGIPMLPAEMTLRPRVAPYLPRAPEGVASVRPRQLVRLADGDTLRLTAGIVRRSIKGIEVTMFAFNDQHPGPLIDVRQGARITVVAHEQARSAHDRPLAWDPSRQSIRRRPGPHAASGAPRGTFRVRHSAPGRRHLLVSPARARGHPAGPRPVRQLLVRSPRADYFSFAHREEVLMLDDLLVNDDGLVPFGGNAATHALMGRFGNVLLVNGEPRYSLTVQAGEVVRFFLTNVSNTRTFNLSFAGARMKVVAGDVGNFEREEWVESVVIAPAERYVVHVRFDRPGDVALVNRVHALDHLFGRFSLRDRHAGRGARAARRRSHAESRRAFDDAAHGHRGHDAELARLRRSSASAPDKSLVLDARDAGTFPSSPGR